MKNVLLDNMKERRKVAGYTQSDVEKALGFRDRLIYDYENGRCVVGVVNAVKIAEFLECSVYDLLNKDVVKQEDKSELVIRLFRELASKDKSSVARYISDYYIYEVN